MANIILKDIEKIYPNGFKAIHKINLNIKDGEFMVIVGPSGSSKSTILRMIAGLENITNGKIFIGDKLVNSLPPKDRNIAMVFQNYALFPHMTIYENIAYALKILKIPKNEIDKKVRAVAKKLEIIELLDRKPDEISGGQKQRVALGRAIIRKPHVFLFDEPLSNLDTKLKVSMRVKILELHKELKSENQSFTMIYVTHDQVEAMTMGDRICVLNYGRIMQVDTPLNLYNKPANKFVAGFIGSPSMNFVNGRLEKEGEKVVFIFGNNRHIILTEEMSKKVESYIGKEVILGIRPENLGNRTTHPEGEEENFLNGEISIVEHMGNEEFIYFTIDGQEFTSRIEARKSEGVKHGETGKFYFNIKRAHIFDAETEENISL